MRELLSKVVNRIFQNIWGLKCWLINPNTLNAFNSAMPSLCVYVHGGIFTLINEGFKLLGLTLIRQGGGWISPNFFQTSISPENRGLDITNFVTFANSLWTFRKSKKMVFHSFLGWIRRCRHIVPPLTQATFKSPAPLVLKNKCYICILEKKKVIF